jgi:Lrp/AsnC family transcriptional regulator, regulator for asnA, asnC and gidA
MKREIIDEKLINELILNAKTPLRVMAKKLKLSIVTVLNHIRRLEKEGIIKSYSARINYEKLGYDVHAMIELRISKGKLLELERKLAKFSNVYAVYDTTGDWDSYLLARFKSTRQLDSFVKEIQTYDFIERTNTILILNTVKDSQAMM